MKKLVKTNWLSKYDYSFFNGGDFRREELEKILKIFEESKATYVEINGGDCSFYREEEETDEEFEKRVQEKEGTLEFIEKMKYYEALETVERLKHKFLK